MKKDPAKNKAEEDCIYNYLLKCHHDDPSRWVGKKELLNHCRFLEATYHAHDICARLNAIRLSLNRRAFAGEIKNIVLLSKDCFRLANNSIAERKYLERDYQDGCKRLTRYFENVAVLNSNLRAQKTKEDPHNE